MLQLWIIPAISPIEAVRTGRDAAVCGDCKFRGDGAGNERTCYVEYFRSVENIWQSQRRADRTDRQWRSSPTGCEACSCASAHTGIRSRFPIASGARS
jgi:hypothetical protein